MIWKSFFAAVLATLIAAPVWSAPTVNVRLLRIGDPIVGPVILDSNGNYQWEVLVSPDQALAAGGNGVVDIELAFRLAGTGLVGASIAVPADWPANHAGPVPAAFGSGFEWLTLNNEDEAEGLQFDLANDEVFAGLESINFTNGNSRRVLLIKTAGPSLPTGSPLSARTTTIEWGGAYDGFGLMIQGVGNPRQWFSHLLSDSR